MTEYHLVQRFCGGNYLVYEAMPQDVLARWGYMIPKQDARERELRREQDRADALSARSGGSATNFFTMPDED